MKLLALTLATLLPLPLRAQAWAVHPALQADRTATDDARRGAGERAAVVAVGGSAGAWDGVPGAAWAGGGCGAAARWLMSLVVPLLVIAAYQPSSPPSTPR